MNKNKSPIKLKHGKVLASGLMLLVFIGLLIAFILLSITKGAVNVPFQTVRDAFGAFDSTNNHHLYIMDLRLPRTLASALAGAAFAAAGAIMQGITRNPLADAGLLGLNAGAGFALAICFAFFPKVPYLQLLILSFFGAAGGAALVKGISGSNGSNTASTRLILSGAAVTALLAALSQGIALCFDVAQDMMFWTVGGVAGSNWLQIRIMAPLILGALVSAILMSPAITLMSLGEETAKGLGLNTRVINSISTIIVLILAGVSVSVVGGVGFVGLIIPHIARLLVGVDYRWIIPISSVLGGILMVIADIGARTINPPFETPLGALTALVGVPFFIYLSRRKRRTT